MYDFRSLYFYAVYCVIIGIGMAILLLKKKKSLRGKRKKDDVLEILLYTIVLIFCVDNTVSVCSAIHSPVIKQYQGIYMGKHRGMVEFEKSKDSDYEDSFYIPLLLRGRMCVGGFQKEEKYKLYYEERTEVLVKIKKIS
nr:hypothetical protein [uncultured Dorea sp.]